MDVITHSIFISKVIKPAVEAFDSGLSPAEVDQATYLVPSLIHEYSLAGAKKPFKPAIELAALYVLGLRQPEKYLGDQIKASVSALPRFVSPKQSATGTK
jgi:hypothetical protein